MKARSSFEATWKQNKRFNKFLVKVAHKFFDETRKHICIQDSILKHLQIELDRQWMGVPGNLKCGKSHANQNLLGPARILKGRRKTYSRLWNPSNFHHSKGGGVICHKSPFPTLHRKGFFQSHVNGCINISFELALPGVKFSKPKCDHF